jgi:acetyl esterase/lipase
MVDRFLVWLGTGVVMAGVSAAVLAGSGVAMATDGASDDGGDKSTSESSDSTGAKDNSGANNSSPTGPEGNDVDKKDDDPADAKKDAGDGDKDASTAEDAKGDDATDEKTGEGANGDEVTGEDVIEEDVTGTDEEPGEFVDLTQGEHNNTGSRTNDVQANYAENLRQDPPVVDGVDALGPAANLEGENADTKLAVINNDPEPVQEQRVVALTTVFDEQPEEPEFSAVAFAAPLAAPVSATATAPLLNVLLDVVGTIIFGIYNFAIQLFGGPPMLPPGSTVTVLSSRLRLDCGCAPGSGETVPVDWYIPKDPEPDRIIYLQHGFLAAGPWYSYTAATLAEQTKSIVVAPSITSNFLKYDQCWLGGAPMHQAMAGLFKEGNTALSDSALAAGYAGAIPDRVVLMGHSAGGSAVSGIARYMTENRSIDRLAGVVLLDGVGMNGKMAEDLAKVPDEIPIYQLAAPKYMWNMFGSGTTALMQARPDAEFYGVTLAGGSHVDTMRGGNFLIQFSQQLVAGFSRPQNVAAAQILMVGWVNDMFDPDGPRQGIYLDRGETFALDTPAGQATLVDLPNSLRRPYLLNFLEPFMAGSAGLFNLQPGCLRESTGTAAGCTSSVAA